MYLPQSSSIGVSRFSSVVPAPCLWPSSGVSRLYLEPDDEGEVNEVAPVDAVLPGDQVECRSPTEGLVDDTELGEVWTSPFLMAVLMNGTLGFILVELDRLTTVSLPDMRFSFAARLSSRDTLLDADSCELLPLH